MHNLKKSVTLYFRGNLNWQVHSFIRQWLHSPLLGPGLFFSFIIVCTKTVGLLGRVISPSQGRYLHRTTQRLNAHADIHASSVKQASSQGKLIVDVRNTFECMVVSFC
jgi:hypothetical protein